MIARAPDASAFVDSLRRTRRSAWLLIGLCCLVRIGDAAFHQGGGAGNPAAAMVSL